MNSRHVYGKSSYTPFSLHDSASLATDFSSWHKKKFIATNADLFFDICWLDSQSSMGGTTLL